MACCALALVFSFTAAQAEEKVTARFMGAGEAREAQDDAGRNGALRTNLAHPLVTTASPTPAVMVFNAAQVGVVAASAQTLTASFALSGYTGSFTPTASLHYGLGYSLGKVNCTAVTGGETCTVPVTFIPKLPGARKDALLLMNGSTTLATVLLGGVGQAPMALMQPGVTTNAIANESYYIYQSTVDENGTVYFISDLTNEIYSYTKAGVLSELPLIGLASPHGIDIDGAGTLYIADNTNSHNLTTYSAAGLQGTLAINPPGTYTPCVDSNDGAYLFLYGVGVDDEGDVFVLDRECGTVFERKADGSVTANAINPTMIQPSDISVDAAGDVFIGGYAINQLAMGGTQTQVNTIGASYGVAVDAAGTLYPAPYGSYGGVGQLLPADYTTSVSSFDKGQEPLGDSVAADGTIWIGNYGNLDKVDRSQGAIAFGSQSVNVESSFQLAGIYNGGNEPLTVSSIVESGAGFTMVSSPISPCSNGIVLEAGAMCQMSVSMTAPHAGTFTGAIKFTSNSLNTKATVQTVSLSGYSDGVYIAATPSPLALGSQVAGGAGVTKTVTLSNQGYVDFAYIETPTSSDPAFQPTIGTCTVAMNVGTACQLGVKFTPSQAKAYSATITVPISSSGPQVPALTFTVTGAGLTTAALTPKAISFGEIAVNEASATKTITLKNTGLGAMAIANGGIAVTGTGAASFKVITTCGSTLAAGASCPVTVSFRPTALGTLTAELKVSDTAAESPQTVVLSGVGAAQSTLSTAGLTFAETKVGSASAGQIVELKNTGREPLKIAEGGITITGADANSFVKSTNCTGTVNAGANCSITVKFKPAVTGTLVATLEVKSDATSSPQSVGLRGVGASSATLSAEALAFPKTVMGVSSAAKTVVLKNSGKVPVKIATGGIKIVGTGATSFSEATTCGSTLAKGASCNIFVVFKPKTRGSLAASLEVVDDAIGSRQKVTLSGTGQ
jgi:streptogramin lyase